MRTPVVPSALLLIGCLCVSLLTGCAPKKATATLTEKDRASFRGGPMPASARQEMAKWIEKSQSNQKKATGSGPTAAEAASAAIR